ncbi:hypothetical protein [Bifidobacterium margollesii]|uniref:hypothetical protein n=1 Tax=Bifidobacterium margollesii TaxID=2020964 RepID=UPI000C76F420|nr:hypothetical protein [Bifidobacterium margollesii]
MVDYIAREKLMSTLMSLRDAPEIQDMPDWEQVVRRMPHPQCKYYPVDNGFRNLANGFNGSDRAHPRPVQQMPPRSRQPKGSPVGSYSNQHLARRPSSVGYADSPPQGGSPENWRTTTSTPGEKPITAPHDSTPLSISNIPFPTTPLHPDHTASP